MQTHAADTAIHLRHPNHLCLADALNHARNLSRRTGEMVKVYTIGAICFARPAGDPAPDAESILNSMASHPQKIAALALLVDGHMKVHTVGELTHET